MNTINITNSYRHFAFYQQDSKTETTTPEEKPLAKQLEQTSSRYINLSKEAKDKLEQENKTLGRKIAGQMQEQKAQTTGKIDEATEQDNLDTMIEQVQEQIKDIEKRLRLLRNKQSETEEAEIKMLEAQLLNLNANLMALIGKKFDAAKA
ncbi:hypothetical protein tinsulaeT_03120 [Thalassotalea insulae]|uniref:Uncharacterized protein n=1 Tax=Thalassotalea insulae TaxID=2056778 RepID=A0ABQ6GNQ1_9GAMM|nr:hypothetical protein [Thalassotalea insulae]GLX76972.1 hypothetical protein tinsulaeT_03120 [Thalassotalea insulae]